MRFAILCAILLPMASCGGTGPSPELKQFQEQALPRSTPIIRVVVSDRRFGRSTYMTSEPWDLADVDEKVFARLRASLPASVKVERARGPRDTALMQASGKQVMHQTLLPGTIYVTVLPFPQHALGRPSHQTIEPSLWLQGNANDLGNAMIGLNSRAPGDVACQAKCTSAEQAFKAIQGRIEVVVLRVAGDKSR